jgi:hypothetical protein
VSVLIHTDTEQVVRLKYRKVGADNWKKVHDTADTMHSFRITDLKEGTAYEYYFQNNDSERITQTYTFHTKRSVTNDAPLRVAVFGDSGVYNEDQFRVGAQITWWNPEVLLHTGDIAYDAGTEEQYAQTFFNAYVPLLAQVPFYGSIGNHDEATDAAGPYKKFLECPTAYSDSEDYYAFDYGPAHFVSLNSNNDYSEGSEMYNWLVNDLAQTDKRWKIVYFHHPLYSSGYHGSTAGMADILGPVFEDNGVQLVLNGHDHDYERNQKVHGVLYIVTGGGGGSLYEHGFDNVYSSIFESRFHFVGLQISKNALTGQAIDENGYIFDDFVLTQ